MTVVVDAPTVRPPAPGGLLDVAAVHEATDPHVQFGVEYQTWRCGTGGYTAGCVDAPAGVDVDHPKQFSGSELVAGTPFGVYAGVVCDLFGAPYIEQARDRLTGGEGRAVAHAWGAVLASTATVLDSTPVTGDTLAAALGTLEQYAAEVYTGLPVLHMSLHTATLAVSQRLLVKMLDGVYVTGLGTPVAVSAGYPDGVIYLSGAVDVWRSPVEAHEVPALGENKSYALAERVYVVTGDCLAAAVGTVPA